MLPLIICISLFDIDLEKWERFRPERCKLALSLSFELVFKLVLLANLILKYIFKEKKNGILIWFAFDLELNEIKRNEKYIFVFVFVFGVVLKNERDLKLNLNII